MTPEEQEQNAIQRFEEMRRIEEAKPKALRLLEAERQYNRVVNDLLSWDRKTKIKQCKSVKEFKKLRDNYIRINEIKLTRMRLGIFD